MFKKTIQPFGRFKQYTLEDKATGDRFSVVPEHGACLTELVLAGTSLLDSYTDPASLIENKWSKSAFLFPFPNRLRDGVYHFNQQQYVFPINNPATGNAIHGFGKDKPMVVDRIACTKQSACIACSYTHRGDHAAYPFSFVFSVIMTLHQDRTFELEMSFRNNDSKPMPAGIGWHPYFSIADNTDEVRLKMPACRRVLIDDRMLPTGEKTEFSDFEREKILTGITLDNCFEVPEGRGKFQLHLRSSAGQLTYWQETGPKGYPFIQLFTPDHRKSVAIEPMTCNVDAFNNGDGLAILGNGAELRGKCGLQWQAL